MQQELPLPPHFNPERVGEVWRVAYQELAETAEIWAADHSIQPAHTDRFKVCLVTVDVQNTFCIPGFELYVGGRSGTGAVNDNRHLCEFIYRNLHRITYIVSTLDTHQAMQIFHGIFLIDNQGKHPPPFTQITVKDVEDGYWKFNPAVSHRLQIIPELGQRHLLYYVKKLQESGKYDLTVWPYHSMLGGIGHALVSAVEEAIFFHSMTRRTQPDFHIKGEHPLTEHYSVLGPEVNTDPDGKRLTQKTDKLFHMLRHSDAVIITGQAKSHCVAWTIADLLEDIKADPNLVRKIYLLEDCTSPVVIPGVIDYTEEADAAFSRFAEAGMHIVRSTEPITHWPDLKDRINSHL